MTTKEETLLDWLRDAHSMKQQAITMLTAMAGRIENYPEVKARIEDHIEETRRQANSLESCIERQGGNTSTVKDLMGKFTLEDNIDAVTQKFLAREERPDVTAKR